jgi:hypothetical protein
MISCVSIVFECFLDGRLTRERALVSHQNGGMPLEDLLAPGNAKDANSLDEALLGLLPLAI